MKDLAAGEFDTTELESAWDVELLPLPRRCFGSPLAKLECLFLEEPQRMLVIDSDIVLAGPLLDTLNEHDEDFVVAPTFTPQLDKQWLSRIYFDLDSLQSWDASYSYPGYVYNTGQVVCTSGIVARDDFDELVDWDCTRPELKRPDIFRCSDQGILNYVLAKKAAKGELSIGSREFKVNPLYGVPFAPSIEHVTQSGGFPHLIHWAGRSPGPTASDFILSDFLEFFESYYHTGVRFGRLKIVLRRQLRQILPGCRDMLISLGNVMREGVSTVLPSPIKRALKRTLLARTSD